VVTPHASRTADTVYTSNLFRRFGRLLGERVSAPREVVFRGRIVKVCRRCGFQDRNSRGDCRACKSATAKTWRKENAVEARARDHKRRKEKPEQQEKTARLPTTRHRHALRADRAKNRETMTLEDYLSFEGRPCHYCGFPRPAKGIGLDRINNGLGHTLKNSLPCCDECNIARSNHLTVAEMITTVGPAICVAKTQRQLRGRDADSESI